MAGDRRYYAKTPSPAMESDSTPAKKKYPGWKAMPYFLGNETFERLATFGLAANFMVYFMREYHLSQVSAANFINIWWGITNFTPLLGAFISDSYAGKFKTIAFSSFACVLGMLVVTLTAWLPQLRPPKCDMESFSQCKGPNKSQMGVLLTGLGLLSIGTGGIRPCSIAFGVDQFDPTTENGVRAINSFFNWYYASFNMVLLIAQTVTVYIQDSVSWALGFGIPTLLMITAIILLFIGKKLYVYVEPQGSIFSSIAQVFVAAYKKRRLKLPEGDHDQDGIFYDHPAKGTVLKFSITNQFRFLNKAMMIMDNELKSDKTPINRWRLCSIQQVEDVKCLIKIIPIWVTDVICLTTMVQQSTFTVSQAMKMDRHLGPKFEIPAGSMAALVYLTVAIWLPIYDRILVPALRKFTKHEGGITVLQRCGIGNIFSFLAMIVAGLVERKRRASANLHPNPLGIAPLHVMWLAPQIILLGFCEAFLVIGFIEFYNKEFPDHMKSLANALQFCSVGGGSYLSSLIISIIHGTTGKHGHPDWLADDINVGKLDYFYFVIAGLGILNFIYFLYCTYRYRYKCIIRPEAKPQPDLELAGSVRP